MLESCCTGVLAVDRLANCIESRWLQPSTHGSAALGESETRASRGRRAKHLVGGVRASELYYVFRGLWVWCAKVVAGRERTPRDYLKVIATCVAVYDLEVSRRSHVICHMWFVGRMQHVD